LPVADELKGGGTGVDDRCHSDGQSGGRKLAIDAEMIAAEGASADDRNMENLAVRIQSQRYALVRLLFALNDAQAARVQFEKVGHLVLRAPGRAGDESGGRAGGSAESSGGGNKFEQIQGDVLVATGATGRILGLVHELPPTRCYQRLRPEVEGRGAASEFSHAKADAAHEPVGGHLVELQFDQLDREFEAIGAQDEAIGFEADKAKLQCVV